MIFIPGMKTPRYPLGPPPFCLYGNALALRDRVPAQVKAKVCLECHVPQGQSPDPMIPKLDGQQAEYIVRQVLDYKSGRRPSTIMREVAQIVSDMQDLLDIAAFYSNLETMQGSGEINQEVKRGEVIYVDYRCHFCHGEEAVAGTAFTSGAPLIGGQNKDYLEKTMLDIKMGRRPADIYNLMKRLLLRLSDKEIEALSAYVSSLQVTSNE